MTDSETRDESRWSGNYPLPEWWDGVMGAEPWVGGCWAPWPHGGTTHACRRPSGHAGRHMVAHTDTMRPTIIRAWPGATEPTRTDLDDRDDQGVLCRCDCDCPDCAETVRHDGWRYLWVGPWWVGYCRVPHRGIAIAAGKDNP